MTKTILEEAKMIQYGARLEGSQSGEMRAVDGWKRPRRGQRRPRSTRPGSGGDEGALLRELRDEEERKMRSKLMVDLRRERAGMRRPRAVECFACSGKGHMARYCPSRNTKDERNKRSSPYCYERPAEAVAKVIAVIRKEACVPERKRTRVSGSIGDLVDKFPEVHRGQENRIEFYQDERVVKRGQIVPESLRERTRKHLENLKRRGVIRQSWLKWRNLIRALEKLNGGVWVVSNLMALNDLVVKTRTSSPTFGTLCERRRARNGSW
ncbi:UNVERIFIED_CONTAM: hypothetical protein PYX00_011540 [Menopon gallinae]|uniref:CCHC-type domain-containing protein n=1 Tax=Menopon gallinae TaxID=328185 RepID=A0AAW2H7U5_9NEOP